MPKEDINLANNTIQRIRKALQQKSQDGMPDIIRLIQELSNKAFTITVTELADLIQENENISNKILKAANTLAYNPSGAKVKNIPQAIQVIGFERIRNLAISLMLLENAEQSMSEDEQKDVAAITLASAIFAREVMKIQKTHDPELAFVCASLRNYGHILMTNFLLDEYRKAIELSKDEGDDAFRMIFGITPLELGYQLLLSAHLPKPILKALQAIREDTIQLGAKTKEEKLLNLSEYTLKLSHLSSDSNIPATDFIAQVQQESLHYGKEFKLEEEVLFSIFKQAKKELDLMEDALGNNSSKNRICQCIEARANSKDPPPPRAKANSSSNENDLLKKAGQPHVKSGQPATEVRDIFLEGITNLEQQVSQRPIELNKIFKTVINTLTEALELSDCMIFTKSHYGNDYMLYSGKGEIHKKIQGQPVISSTNKDVYSICLKHKEDILIENAEEPKIVPFIPEWMKEGKAVNSFFILPVKKDDSITAIIAGCRSDGKSIQLTSSTLQRLKAIRIQMRTAMSIAL